MAIPYNAYVQLIPDISINISKYRFSYCCICIGKRKKKISLFCICLKCKEPLFFLLIFRKWFLLEMFWKLAVYVWFEKNNNLCLTKILKFPKEKKAILILDLWKTTSATILKYYFFSENFDLYISLHPKIGIALRKTFNSQENLTIV